MDFEVLGRGVPGLLHQGHRREIHRDTPTLTIGTIFVDADLTNAVRNAAKKTKNIKGSRNEDVSITSAIINHG